MPLAGYNETIIISRVDPTGSGSGAGTQNATTGVFTPTDPETTHDGRVVIYEGVADVQDKPEVLTRDKTGQPLLTADGQIFLRDEAKIGLIKVRDIVEVTWSDGRTSDGEVMQVQRLDGSVYIRRLDNV